MMTHEDVLSIEQYFAEHKLSHKKRLYSTLKCLNIIFFN